MDPAVPIIFTPDPRRHRASALGRLLAAAICVACLATLALAAIMPPAKAGVGSHRYFGFDSCQFLERSGLPCPSCGMSTSFAHFVRGNWLASFYVQPMGFVLALLCACSFWASLYIAITGNPVYRLMRFFPANASVIGLMAFAIAAWSWKIFIHLRHTDGWG